MGLRCVIAVIRHGDRTPKQKMKMEVRHPKFFQLFQRLGGYRTGQLKIKRPKQLQEILDIVRFLLQQNELGMSDMIEENKVKLEHLKLVLEMYGHFSGINRKVQMKYRQQGHQKWSSSEDEEPQKPSSLLLIAKWGGELTPAGRTQAQDLGKAFRSLYPGGQGEYESPGLGILRLHSTYRHDLKIYASDEGRVQMTAAAFTKGFLALEGELPPILVQMVKCANTNGLLDSEGESTKYQQVVKEKLMTLLNRDADFTPEDADQLNPTHSASLKKAMDKVKNPRKVCENIYSMIKILADKVRNLKADFEATERTEDECPLYNGETWDLSLRRWAKLEKDFYLKSGNFDISKIPDIYDCIKYDLQHNERVLNFDNAEKLFGLSKALADIVIPQEYGITQEEKLHIAQSYCMPLLHKIHGDLNQVMSQEEEEDETTRLDSRYSRGIATPHRFVRTRLYFTSESHIHSLLTMLRYADFLDENKDKQWKKATEFISSTAELNYMTQIVVMMYEDGSKTGPDRFHVELHFSPGAHSPATLKDYNTRASASWPYTSKAPDTKISCLQWNVLAHRHYLTLANRQLSPHKFVSPITSPARVKDPNHDDVDWKWDFDDDSPDRSLPKSSPSHSSSPIRESHSAASKGCYCRFVYKHQPVVLHTLVDHRDKSRSTGDLRKKALLEDCQWDSGTICRYCQQNCSQQTLQNVIREEESSGSEPIKLASSPSQTLTSANVPQVDSAEDKDVYSDRDESIDKSNTDNARDEQKDTAAECLTDVSINKKKAPYSSLSRRVSEPLDIGHRLVNSGDNAQTTRNKFCKSGFCSKSSDNNLGLSNLGENDSATKGQNDDITKEEKVTDTSNITCNSETYSVAEAGEMEKTSPQKDIQKSEHAEDGSIHSIRENSQQFGSLPNRAFPISIQCDMKNEVSRSQSWEEKSLQSLKINKSTDEFSGATSDKHYLTVHLPLHDSANRYPYPSIITFANLQSDQPNKMLTLVPHMQPLETLHNSLTMEHMSQFLDRLSHKKYITPLSTPPTCAMSPISYVSPLQLLTVINPDRTEGSFCSSANSSAGPSTPTTTASTHEDIAARLQQIITNDS